MTSAARSSGPPADVVVGGVECARKDLAPGWDAFVDCVGGDHVQTTRWAAVKAVVGWTSARVGVRRDGELVGGCQLLLRRLPPFGSIAYGSRCPMAVGSDPETIESVLGAVQEFARRQRLVLLKLQPPVGGFAEVPALERRGFVASSLGTAPAATVRLDLRQSNEGLLAAMRPSCRSNIGKARRKGVTVRTGTSADLVRFLALVEATSRRQGFSPYPARYYQALWDQFSPDDHARLLIAEHEGLPLSAALLVAWGGVVTYKMGGWSGARAGVHPNELLHWTGIEWAREAGYQWYDLEGINEEVGQAIVEGRDPGAGAHKGVTHFKLGLGGEVVLSPGGYDYSPRPLLAAAVRRVGSMASRHSWLVNGLLGRGR